MSETRRTDSTGSAQAAGSEPTTGAHRCDGKGGARPIALDATGSVDGGDGWLWVHLDRAESLHQSWLLQQSGLDPIACEALLEEETRPRVVTGDDWLLVILRGVNLNPGAEPDDMISLRLWIDGRRLISLRHRRLLAVQDVRTLLLAGKGPCTPGDFLIAVIGRLVDRQVAVVDALEDAVDEVEEQLLSSVGRDMRSKIAQLRRQAIGLRRYIAPQRDALHRLAGERTSWLDDRMRARLREIQERQTRLVEEVDAARERAVLAQEELNGRLSEQMNGNMYMLSLIAGVFLPLGLVTGLLGINVGGLPGTDDPYAFAIVCALLLVMAGIVLWLFRRMRML